jgi:AhpD family alkylhydroperoxidase
VTSVRVWAVRRVGPGHIRHLTPVRRKAAVGLVGRLYERIEAEFGMLAPPLALHAAAPEVLAGVWLIVRETLLVEGRVTRAAKEAVASAVSLANTCPYCLDVHGATLIGLRGDSDARAIVADQLDRVADPQLRALVGWARVSGLPAGGAPAPFSAEQAAELIGIACVFHYINRMVNMFLAKSPLPATGPALGLVRRTAASIMRGLAKRRAEPGLSLDLLPDAPLPADLSWTSGQPILSAAWARAAHAMDAAGERSVPAPVRDLVRTELASRHPGPPDLNVRSWLDTTVAELPDAQRPAARLALLVAFASYRVTPQYVDDWREQGNDDRALIELTSWASFTAARQIGSNLKLTLPKP